MQPSRQLTPINADTSGAYINGTIKIRGTGVKSVTVYTNTSITTTTDASGFYSLPVPTGTISGSVLNA